MQITIDVYNEKYYDEESKEYYYKNECKIINNNSKSCGYGKHPTCVESATINAIKDALEIINKKVCCVLNANIEVDSLMDFCQKYKFAIESIDKTMENGRSLKRYVLLGHDSIFLRSDAFKAVVKTIELKKVTIFYKGERFSCISDGYNGEDEAFFLALIKAGIAVEKNDIKIGVENSLRKRRLDCGAVFGNDLSTLIHYCK